MGTHRHAPSPTEIGSLFEQWLILQILFYSRAHKLSWQISAFRTDGGAEVDVVVDTGRELLAIECKAGRNVSPRQVSGLQAFLASHRKARGLVVFRGSVAQTLDSRVEAVPIEHFLGEIIPGL